MSIYHYINKGTQSLSHKHLSLILNGGSVPSTIEISEAVMSVLSITGNSKVMTFKQNPVKLSLMVLML